MDAEQHGALKQLALAAVSVGLIAGASVALTTFWSRRAEAKAQSMLQAYLRPEDVQFGRFVDYKNGNACLEFAILPGGPAARRGAARFAPERDGSSKGVIKQITPTLEQCKIGAAG